MLLTQLGKLSPLSVGVVSGRQGANDGVWSSALSRGFRMGLCRHDSSILKGLRGAEQSYSVNVYYNRKHNIKGERKF